MENHSNAQKEQEKIKLFQKILSDTNMKMNLMSKRDIDYFWEKHVFDSLVGLRYLNNTKKLKILDFGSGNGFPGVVLSVVLPENKFFLLESKTKKCTFLDNVIKKIGINAEVINGRLENIATEYMHFFDVILMRAVGDIDEYYKIFKNILKKEGFLLAWKGRNYDLDKKNSYTIENHYKYKLKTPNQESRIILKIK